MWEVVGTSRWNVQQVDVDLLRVKRNMVLRHVGGKPEQTQVVRAPLKGRI